MELFEDYGKRGKAHILNNFGIVHLRKKEYNKAIEYFDKTHKIIEEINLGDEARHWNVPLRLLTYKKLGKKYDENEIYKLIRNHQHFEMEPNYYIYQILEDTSYLETAYNQVQEQADNLEPDVAAKFLSYPIPAAIVEEWEKVK